MGVCACGATGDDDHTLSCSGVSLPELARRLSKARSASIVVLQIKKTAPRVVFCEDAGSFRSDDGPEHVMLGLCSALEGMLTRAQLELAAIREALQQEPPE